MDPWEAGIHNRRNGTQNNHESNYNNIFKYFKNIGNNNQLYGSVVETREQSIYRPETELYINRSSPAKTANQGSAGGGR